MFKKPILLFLLLPALTVLSMTTAMAQTFDATLAGRSLGTLTFTDVKGDAALRTTLNNTPLGVFDGTFVGTSRRVQTDQGAIMAQYFSEGISSRKTRQISVLMDQGQVIETVVSPKSERTDLSNPARVTGPVVDPVTALGQMVSASGCPGSMRIYDGRRLIGLTPAGSASETNTLTCDMRYFVDAGPGHLSPLYITKISVTLNYDVTGDRQELMHMQFSSGIFSLGLTRHR